MITFAKSLDADQCQQNVGSDLDPNVRHSHGPLNFFFFLKKLILKKKSADDKNMKTIPSRLRV